MSQICPQLCGILACELRQARRGTWNLGFFIAVLTWDCYGQLSGALA